ncbi:MAG: hypothetical protein CVV30_08945 [Methanomicrobiales archaeon HGW-Methanomicrobiales-1]|jgi:hypothetical protein|nr:MAG: hypothetical protein CVV30_08945 [Methanomicrobiales archaeon HGW-Methanomicrobiales-1]
MARQEHVHIVTAGENIFPAFAATVRDNPDITHVYVFADIELYSNSTRDGEEIRKQKDIAREAVNQVRTLAASLKIPAPLVYVSPPADATARDALLKIRKEHPDARFSFDLSAGSKDMCMALFALSLWVQGDAYYTFAERKGEATAAKLAVPKTPAETVAANPNYIKILQMLYNTPGKQDHPVRVVPRSYLFTQLSVSYIPVRKKGVKVAENTMGKTNLYTGKMAVMHKLSQGTFANILRTMVALDLVHEYPNPDSNRKENYYTITPSGALALQLAEIKPRKRE